MSGIDVSCLFIFVEQAKPETVDKVCQIVKKQLALPEDSVVGGDSKFAELGADSLDTVTNYYMLSFFMLAYVINSCYRRAFCKQFCSLINSLFYIALCWPESIFVWFGYNLFEFNHLQVEIVMGLEEEFGISVEEDSAQAIATVQDAADLIEKLIENKRAQNKL